MKLNLLFSSIHPTGGISTWTLNIVNYTKDKSLKDVVFIDASVFFKNGTNSNSFLRRIFISGLLDTSRLVSKFLLSLIKYRPYSVHINTSASLALFKDCFYLFIASFFRIHIIFHYHFGRIPSLLIKKNWECYLLLFCIKHAHHSIVIDPESYNALCNIGLSSKISYIPNPCSSLVESVARLPESKKEGKQYLFVGHVVPQKGVIELVEAFTRFEETVSLLIVGLCSESMKKELIGIAKRKYNGKWLLILGNRDQEFVLSQMKKSEALILPSYTEGFPNVVLEAMACGCPIIATNVGAIPEMLAVGIPNEACGICIPSKSVDEIISAIKFLRDNNKAIFFARNGKKRILKNYILDIIYPKYEKVWNS